MWRSYKKRFVFLADNVAVSFITPRCGSVDIFLLQRRVSKKTYLQFTRKLEKNIYILIYYILIFIVLSVLLFFMNCFLLFVIFIYKVFKYFVFFFFAIIVFVQQVAVLKRGEETTSRRWCIDVVCKILCTNLTALSSLVFFFPQLMYSNVLLAKPLHKK